MEIEDLSGEGIGLSAFFVADHAEAIGGKIYANGACWDTLTVGQLPVQHPHMSVAAALRVPWNVAGDSHEIGVRLVDQDMQDVVPPVQGRFDPGHPPNLEPGDATTIVLAFNLVNVTFHKPGPHTFVISVDGTELGRARFKVLLRD